MSETKTNYQGAKIEHIPLSDIAPSALNPRKHFDSDGMIALADDIAMNGVLQPITIRFRAPETPVGDAGMLNFLDPPLSSRPYQIVVNCRCVNAPTCLSRSTSTRTVRVRRHSGNNHAYYPTLALKYTLVSRL